MSTFGSEIKRVRQAKKLTQRQVAESAGMPSNHLGLIENGRIRCPRVDVAWNITRALGVSLDKLLAKIAA